MLWPLAHGLWTVDRVLRFQETAYSLSRFSASFRTLPASLFARCLSHPPALTACTFPRLRLVQFCWNPIKQPIRPVQPLPPRHSPLATRPSPLNTRPSTLRPLACRLWPVSRSCPSSGGWTVVPSNPRWHLKCLRKASWNTSAASFWQSGSASQWL